MQLLHGRVQSLDGVGEGLNLAGNLVDLGTKTGHGRKAVSQLAFDLVIDGSFEDPHRRRRPVGCVEGLLAERLLGGHLLVERSLQLADVFLQERDVALDFLCFFAGRVGRGGK